MKSKDFLNGIPYDIVVIYLEDWQATLEAHTLSEVKERVDGLSRHFVVGFLIEDDPSKRYIVLCSEVQDFSYSNPDGIRAHRSLEFIPRKVILFKSVLRRAAKRR